MCYVIFVELNKYMDNIEHLISELRSADFPSQIHAIRELGIISDPRAIDALLQAMADSNFQIPEEIAKAFGELKSPHAVDTLIKVLNYQNDWRLRTYASWALGEIGNPRAGDQLLSLLDDGVGDVQQSVRHALVKLNDKRIIPKLINDLFNPQEWVRYESALLLGRIGDERALPELEQLAETHVQMRKDIDVRKTAQEASRFIRQRGQSAE